MGSGNRAGYCEHDFDVIEFRQDREQYRHDLLKSTTEELIFNLCDGDFTKFPEARKLKVSEASIIMIIKEKQGFEQWYEHKQSSAE